MWIQTQDGHDIIDSYHFASFSVQPDKITGRWVVTGEVEKNNGGYAEWMLGSYSTEEQALDVMTQIPIACVEREFEIFTMPKNVGLGYEQIS